MADIAWSAYALAMFSPEQRAAAANVRYVPDDPPVVLPPPGDGVGPGPGTTIIRIGLSTAHLRDSTGLDPNNAADLAVLTEQGWQFQNGQWFKVGGSSTSGGAGTSVVSGGPKPTGAYAMSGAIYGGGSVLGYAVPVAPAVLLPSFVGGRIGVIRHAGGLRPESGGGRRIVKTVGQPHPWTRIVRPAGRE